MNPKLLTDADLIEITGMKRYSKQAAWFKRSFEIDVVTDARGRPIMTWSTYEALCAKRAGIVLKADAAGPAFEICYD